jgi:hypothetical protein
VELEWVGVDPVVAERRPQLPHERTVVVSHAPMMAHIAVVDPMRRPRPTCGAVVLGSHPPPHERVRKIPMPTGEHGAQRDDGR